MSQFDVIVVGAGVSGLVFAEHAATAGQSVLVLEKEADVGGCLSSWEAAPGYFVELGAHTAYNSYGQLLSILQKRGRLAELLTREKLGYHFLNEERLQSPMARVNMLEAALHVPFGLFKSKVGADLKTYFGTLLGKRNYAQVLSPAFAAVLSQPCDDFPAEWLFRRKPRMQEAPRKFSWATGLQGLLKAVTQDAGFQVRLSAPVESVERDVAGYTVRTAGENLSCQMLAVATPPDVAANLLGSAAPGTASLLNQFPMAEIESMAVRVDKDKVTMKPLAGVIGLDDDFFSVVSRDPLPHDHYRAFTFHFRPGRLGQQAKLVRIAAVLGVAISDFDVVAERINRLPALDMRHPALATQLDASVVNQPLALLGNYFTGMSIGDCAERSVSEAQRLFNKGVQP